MNVMTKDGAVLLIDGAVATDPACCCDCGACEDCFQSCNTCTQYTTTATVVAWPDPPIFGYSDFSAADQAAAYLELIEVQNNSCRIEAGLTGQVCGFVSLPDSSTRRDVGTFANGSGHVIDYYLKAELNCIEFDEDPGELYLLPKMTLIVCRKFFAPGDLGDPTKWRSCSPGSLGIKYICDPLWFYVNGWDDFDSPLLQQYMIPVDPETCLLESFNQNIRWGERSWSQDSSCTTSTPGTGPEVEAIINLQSQPAVVEFA